MEAAVATAEVTEDITPPVATCQDITIQLDGTGNASITANDIDNGSSDNCGIASISVSPNTFNSSDIGDNVVTFTVTDINGLSTICNATVSVEDMTLDIDDDKIEIFSISPNPFKDDIKGSNTFAFNSNKTGNNETYLAINTHQPLDGPTSWYEAHLISEEGTNIIGATFAGAPCILIGANQNLAWAHTVNFPDKADVFELEMHPTKKWHYLVDGKTYKLEKKQAKLFVKFLGIKIKINKKNNNM